jgi:large subunit ribosomal protein L32
LPWAVQALSCSGHQVGRLERCWKDPSEVMIPVRRTSRCRKRKRRSHLFLQTLNTATCPRCGVAKLPHCACSNCGYVSYGVALEIESKES